MPTRPKTRVHVSPRHGQTSATRHGKCAAKALMHYQMYSFIHTPYARVKSRLVPWLARAEAWPKQHLSDRTFLVCTALLVGVISGLAAVVLKNMIHYFGTYVLDTFAADRSNFLLLFLPLIGVGVTYFYVRYIVKDNISHGVSRVLYAISKTGGYLKKSKMYSSAVASTITIGFGGSVGPEAPVVLTGAAIGSNIGRRLQVDYKTMVLLIACGSTGAVAGIFGAPIAGFIFAIEVLMIDLTMGSLLPLLMASLAGTVVSALLMGRSATFHFDVTPDYMLRNLPFYIILGLLAGLASHYFLYMTEHIEKLFSRLKRGPIKLVIGGTLLCGLVFLFPPLYGEGFNFVSSIIQGNTDHLLNNTFWYDYRHLSFVFLIYVLVIMLLKVVAMALTNGSGGVGGVFAPSMFVGAFLGLFLARLFNVIMPSLSLPEANFVLTGMAAVMAGVMHAPLTAIFLVAEISGGYKMFVPLIVVSVTAYYINQFFNPHSIYTKKLAEKGNLMTHNKDMVVLSLLNKQSLVERNFVTVRPQDTLRQLIAAISLSSRNIFPVTDEENRYLGVVFLDEVKPLIFKADLYDKITVKDVMFRPQCTVDMSESMESVAQKFLSIPDYNIAVVDGEQYEGFLSRANVFSSYRQKVKEMSSD